MWAKLLLKGDVIARPYDESENPERIVVLFTRCNRVNGRFTVGCGDKDGNRHTYFFEPEDVVNVVLRAEAS